MKKRKFQMHFMGPFLLKMIHLGLIKNVPKVSFKKIDPFLVFCSSNKWHFLSSTWNSILTHDSTFTSIFSLDKVKLLHKMFLSLRN